jgi:hypothetical protein
MSIALIPAPTALAAQSEAGCADIQQAEATLIPVTNGGTITRYTLHVDQFLGTLGGSPAKPCKGLVYGVEWTNAAGATVTNTNWVPGSAAAGNEQVWDIPIAVNQLRTITNACENDTDGDSTVASTSVFDTITKNNGTTFETAPDGLTGEQVVASDPDGDGDTCSGGNFYH